MIKYRRRGGKVNGGKMEDTSSLVLHETNRKVIDLRTRSMKNTMHFNIAYWSALALDSNHL